MKEIKNNYKWKVFSVVALSAIINVINMSSIFLILNIISNDYNLNLKEASWSFLAQSLTVTALVLPMGRFSDIIGRKKSLILSMSLFSVGSFICFSSYLFSFFIFGRIVMGVGVSILQGVSTAITVSVFPEDERGKAIGALRAATGLGTALGPLLTGFLLEYYSWKLIYFLLSISSGVLCMWIIYILDDSKIGSFQSLSNIFDWKGAILSAITVILLLFSINNPFMINNNLYILGGILFTLISFLILLHHLKNFKFPLIEIKIFKNINFTLSTLTRLFGSINANAVLLLIPILLLNIMSVRQSLIGVVLFFSAIGTIIGSQIGGILSDKYGQRFIVLSGLTLSIISCFIIAIFNNNHSLIFITSIVIVNSLSMGIWNIPNQVMMINKSPKSSYGPVGAFIFLSSNGGIVLGQGIIPAFLTFIIVFQGYNIKLSEVGIISGSSQAFINAWQFTYVLIIMFLIIALIFSKKITN